MRSTCPVSLNLLEFVTVIIFHEDFLSCSLLSHRSKYSQASPVYFFPLARGTLRNCTWTLIGKVKVNLPLCLTEYHAMKVHSLTSALDGGEWSASRPGRFIPRERAPGIYWIGGWMGPRAGLDAVVRRKIPNPRREPNSNSRARSQSLYRLSYHGYLLTRRLEIKRNDEFRVWTMDNIKRLLHISSSFNWFVGYLTTMSQSPG
jgi:hypothetical protein